MLASNSKMSDRSPYKKFITADRCFSSDSRPSLKPALQIYTTPPKQPSQGVELCALIAVLLPFRGWSIPDISLSDGVVSLQIS
jgi:hypothetical protein